MRWLRPKPKLGTLLLAVWLIGTGLFALVPRLGFHGLPEILGLLAIAAGVLRSSWTGDDLFGAGFLAAVPASDGCGPGGQRVRNLGCGEISRTRLRSTRGPDEHAAVLTG
jgi:hypothetical protein